MTLLERLNQRVEETNEAFNKASKAEKRVIIAQDVLDRLNAKQLKARTGQFIHTGMIPNGSVKEHMDSGAVEECQVCAKGAIFMGIIGRKNSITKEELSELDFTEGINNKILKSVFTEKQLDFLEVAYEQATFSYNHIKEGSKKYKRAKKITESFEEWEDSLDDERLRAVVQYVIDKKGKF